MLEEFPNAENRLEYRLSTYSGNTLDMKITLKLDETVENWESYVPQIDS